MARESRFLPDLDFPGWAYTPGEPHPNHSATPVTTPPIGFQSYWHGWDLLLQGYPWEAHEAWEPIWRETTGPTRSWFQGLIRLAAALCKAREKNWPAIDHHLAGACSHWGTIPKESQGPHHGLFPFLESWLAGSQRQQTVQGWRIQSEQLIPGNPGPVLLPDYPGGCPASFLMALRVHFCQTAANSGF